MWPFDQPLYIVVIGIVLGVIVGALWTASGRLEWLYALGAVVAFTLVWLLVERLVVTDREAIRATLLEIARDVQSNDVERVVKHVAKANPELVARAQGEMPNCSASAASQGPPDRHRRQHRATVRSGRFNGRHRHVPAGSIETDTVALVCAVRP
jgi:hypothetical protein